MAILHTFIDPLPSTLHSPPTGHIPFHPQVTRRRNIKGYFAPFLGSLSLLASITLRVKFIETLWTAEENGRGGGGGEGGAVWPSQFLIVRKSYFYSSCGTI